MSRLVLGLGVASLVLVSSISAGAKDVAIVSGRAQTPVTGASACYLTMAHRHSQNSLLPMNSAFLRS